MDEQERKAMQRTAAAPADAPAQVVLERFHLPMRPVLPLVALAAFGLFLLLALDVHFDGLGATLIDRPVGTWIFGHVDPTTRGFLADMVTLPGDDPVVYPLVLLTALYVGARGAWRTGLWMTVTAGMGGALVVGTKLWLDRPRPLDVFIGAEATADLSASFPSGHTANAFIGYGLILFAFAYEAARRRGFIERGVLHVYAAVWVFVVVLNATGRVLAGVHWPTDVVASALLGTGLLALAALAHERWVRPHEVPA